MILEEMMFSFSETGKIEKLLSISITDLKGGDSMNKIKKIREKRGLKIWKKINKKNIYAFRKK